MTLYRPLTHTMIRKFFEDCNVYLYSKIILALPPGNTFIKAFNYRGKGITLWHAIHQDFRSRGSHSHIQSLLAFFYSKALVRDTSESVDDYWNRFQHLVRQLINNPESHTFSQGYLRKRFLATLGNGFEYLVEDEQNKRLDPALLHCTDVELISLLREIQANKSVSYSETLASHGYGVTGHANALKPASTNTVSHVHEHDPRIDTLCSLVTEQAKLLADHSTALAKCITALGKTSKPSVTSKYCWTHGGCNHVSADCRT